MAACLCLFPYLFIASLLWTVCPCSLYKRFAFLQVTRRWISSSCDSASALSTITWSPSRWRSNDHLLLFQIVFNVYKSLITVWSRRYRIITWLSRAITLCKSILFHVCLCLLIYSTECFWSGTILSQARSTWVKEATIFYCVLHIPSTILSYCGLTIWRICIELLCTQLMCP